MSPPALFQKLEKGALLWRKNALIVAIYGLNISFKGEKTGDFFPPGPFFLVL